MDYGTELNGFGGLIASTEWNAEAAIEAMAEALRSPPMDVNFVDVKHGAEAILLCRDTENGPPFYIFTIDY